MKYSVFDMIWNWDKMVQFWLKNCKTWDLKKFYHMNGLSWITCILD